MPTATPFAEPASSRLSDVSDPAVGPEEPLADQPSGRVARRTATRQTDDRGRPLSIFTARRRESVESQYDMRDAEELEATVRSWSPRRS
jgi:hypothetical protein